MRILTRYILKEVLYHGLLGASIFTFVIFMRDVSRILELVVRNSAPVPSVAELFFLTLPTAFTVTIPMGVLVGILIGLSRMASDSEITAMRASGIGVSRFLRIIGIFGIAAWLIALANTVFIAPRSAEALASLQTRLAASQLSFEVQPRVFHENFKDLVIYVQDVKSTSGAAVWKNVFIADTTAAGAPKITVAARAVVTSGGPNRIHAHLENGEIHEASNRAPDNYQINTFQQLDTEFELPPVPPPSEEKIPVAQLTSGALLQRSYSSNKEAARWYWIEFNRRFALPTACLVLVLVGIPLGLSARKGGKGAGFLLTIVLVLIYYFLSITGISFARGGRVPPVLGVWVANIIFGAIGVLLLWRTDKMAVETGIGQALLNEFKTWGRLVRGRSRKDEPVQWRQRSRLFSTRFPLILDDYVLRTFLRYLVLILIALLALFMVFNYFELLSDIVRNKIPLLMQAEYLLNQIPDVLYLVTPLAVLLAVLVAFGVLQKSSEITAMKATGVSIYRMIIPILLIASFIAGGLFILDQFYRPYSNKKVETLRNEIKHKPAQTYLRPDRKWIFGENNTIYFYEVYDPDRDQFGSISAFEFDPKTFQINKRVYAARAHWAESLGKWIFENGWERSFSGDAIQGFQKFDVSTFAELNEPPTYFRKEVKQYSEMNYQELQAYIRDLQQSGFDVVRLKVQLAKKIAFPLITFVMAVLAIPFSLSTGRRGALTGVVVAVAIAVAYWVTSGLFEAMGNVSQLPPLLAAWAPDVIFGLAGGYLILKTPS